jgi:hypothetical protein
VVRARWLLALLAGCPASRPEPVGPAPDPLRPAAEPEVATVAPDAAPPTPPPAPPPPQCGGRSWRDCGAHAATLVASTAAADVRDGMALFRLLCEEGDRRRCFDGTPGDCGPELIDACYQLALLYEAGRGTCPVDLDCAMTLHEMACVAGDPDACAAYTRLREEAP